MRGEGAIQDVRGVKGERGEEHGECVVSNVRGWSYINCERGVKGLGTHDEVAVKSYEYR